MCPIEAHSAGAHPALSYTRSPLLWHTKAVHQPGLSSRAEGICCPVWTVAKSSSHIVYSRYCDLVRHTKAVIHSWPKDNPWSVTDGCRYLGNGMTWLCIHPSCRNNGSRRYLSSRAEGICCPVWTVAKRSS
jgi:hypothetical protein